MVGKMTLISIPALSQHGLVRSQQMDSVLSTFPLTVSQSSVDFGYTILILSPLKDQHVAVDNTGKSIIDNIQFSFPVS